MKEKMKKRLRTKVKDIIQETKLPDIVYSSLKKEMKQKLSKNTIKEIIKWAYLIAIFVGGYDNTKTTKGVEITYNIHNLIIY